MKILVTGGAGYIGSFMTNRLVLDGQEVVVADSLERGHKESVNPNAILQVGDLRDRNFVKKVFSQHSFDGVIHFAGYISMGESMENPYIYFENNITASLNVIEEMVSRNVNHFVFSSTAGVYGNPSILPIPENHPKNPTNPYGESKLMVEKILSWYTVTKNLSYTALRYFNASGALPDGKMGEAHDPETHIIPKIIQSILLKSPFTLYGNDYQTKDGTCVRDYIHVLDLVEAHLLAIHKMQKEPGQYVYNVGTGMGYSNKDIIETVQKVTGLTVQIENAPRRAGDADSLVADVTKIQQELNFTPKYSDLQTIVKSAWEYHRNRNIPSN